MRCALWILQFGIEVSVHQELGPIRPIPDGRINVLYVRDVAGGDITPHNMPPPPPRHQLKADEVRAVEAQPFYSKVLRLAVENCDAAAASTWRLRHHHPKLARIPHVKFVSDFYLL